MIPRGLLVLLLATTLPALSQSLDLPPPPEGQVLDPAAWLDPDFTEGLEAELGRIREAHAIDSMTVVWSRPLPAETTLEELARRLGETWGREELWSITLYAPDSNEQPAVAIGGPAAAGLSEQALAQALTAVAIRAGKEPAPQELVTTTTLEIAEELMFLAHPAPQQPASTVPPIAGTAAPAGSFDLRLLVLAAVGGLGVLGGVGVITFALLRRRPAASNLFPETRWRRRLGGEWSGGSCATATIPSKS